MADDIEEDVYAQHLKEVFDSCDLEHKGYVNRNELIDLSQKLQLGDQVSALLTEVLGSEFQDGKVTFEDFQEGFVNVLAKAIDNSLVETTEDAEWSEFDIVDHFVTSEKYMKPESPVFTTNPVNSIQTFLDNTPLKRKTSTPNVDEKSVLRKRLSMNNYRLPSKDEEVIEGCGTTDVVFSRALEYPDLTTAIDAKQLHKIWDDIAVGESGFINMLQLSTMCEHIGMDSMGDDELELLFTELDTDGDGLVSFNEFFNGLFTEKDNEILSWNDDFSQRSRKSEKLNGSLRGKNLRNDEFKHKAVDILSVLDPGNTGSVKLESVKKYFEDCKMKNIHSILKELTPDADGNIRFKNLTSLLEAVVFEGDDTLYKSMLQTYKNEMFQLRGQLDASSAEISALKLNMSKIGSDNISFIREGEEQMRNFEERNEQKLKEQAQTFAEKLSSKERELIYSRELLTQKHRQENKLLEEQLKQLKTDETNSKNKLKDATSEILRLEENWKLSVEELSIERKKYVRLENELKSAREKIDHFHRHMNTLTEIREQQQSRIKELDLNNTELRDQNDEFLIKIENLSSSLGRDSRQNSTERKFCDDNNVSPNGSYLSSYVKPTVVKRNEFGDSYEEDMSPGINETTNSVKEMEELKAKILDQEAIITSLRRDLETVNRLLDENTSHSNSRHGREISRLTNKFITEKCDLETMMKVERDEMIKFHSNEKDLLAEKYENKIDELKTQFSNERQFLLRDFEKDRDRWEHSSEQSEKEISFKKERRKIENSSRDEKEEIGIDFRSKITKLEEKIVILETEKAEMELKFLNEKSELEQRFRIEKAELKQNASSTSREYDRSQKYIDFLKDDLNKKHLDTIENLERKQKMDKQKMMENMDMDINELNKKHHKDMGELRKICNQQIAELEKSFGKERASMRESFARDKTEMEQKYLREKTELENVLKQDYEYELALQLAHLRKASVEERAEIEENFRAEKYELTKSLQNEKAIAERNLKQMKSEMEMAFAEEKNEMEGNFSMEKARLESKHKKEISELQQAFSGGEAGMKGKMKEDFISLINKYKIEWGDSYEREKVNLQQSFAREKAELELSWQVEKASIEENFDDERVESEAVYFREKQEFVNRYENQKLKLEKYYAEEIERLKENRDEEFNNRVNRETELLKNTVDYLDAELIALKEQKKELETRNQILELKGISQKQEAAEIGVFQSEKKEINQKITALLDEVQILKSEKEKANKELKDLTREKAIILDNSVQEITEQQHHIAELQSEKEVVQDRIEQLLVIENEAHQLKQRNMRITRDNNEKQRMLDALSEVENNNTHLKETIRNFEIREREIEAAMQDRMLKISRLEEEVSHYQKKLDHMESVHKKEFDAQNERLNMQTTAAATEKSRYLRELQELKDHLYRANASSDRDSALKEKVFNDAKAEVINLNKKLEEKSRKIRSLEETLQAMESKLNTSCEQRDDFEKQIHHLKILLNDNNNKMRDEEKSITLQSVRSDKLVTDLYLENANLMKQVANAETNHMKAEKQIRQLTEQKRALQRVISKLCNANGITNLSA